MAMTDKQNRDVEGIVAQLDIFLDRRFEQACRVSPVLSNVETDMRIHQMTTMRSVLSSKKGFGPVRIMVSDILSSDDEAKKRDLFNVVDQVCIIAEIVTEDQDKSGSASKTLDVMDVKSFYMALNPSLGTILNLVQTWLWWDLLDASELYRFEMQEKRLAKLAKTDINQQMIDVYIQEMDKKRGTVLEKKEIIDFEVQRTEDIVTRFNTRLQETGAYQIIPILSKRKGTTEADTACINLAKKLTAISKLQASETLEDNVLRYYSTQLGINADALTREKIIEFETNQADMERANLVEKLKACNSSGKVESYKEIRYADICKRLASIKDKFK